MENSITKEDILRVLSEVVDPELNINIVDLGLIYDIKIKKENEGKQNVYIKNQPKIFGQ